MLTRHFFSIAILSAGVAVASGAALAGSGHGSGGQCPMHGQAGQGGAGGHGGMGSGGHGGMGPGGMGKGARQDMREIHGLLDRRGEIDRKVTRTADGVVTITTSKDPAVAAAIQRHVAAMKSRLETRRPIRMWDPLFAALFGQAGAIEMKIENLPYGVKVVERSSDPWTARLIQAHAAVVSSFVSRGYAEMHAEHPAPPRSR